MTNEFSFELRPSQIHGVGVFARHKINQGAILCIWGDEPAAIETKMENSLIARHCVKWNGSVWRPPCMSRMAIGWYLNHSETPNAEILRDDVVVAARTIESGEEILINYGVFE